MKFKAVGLKEYKGYKETKIQRFLNEFIASDIAVAEVILEPQEYSNISSAYSAVNNAIKRFKNANLSVHVKDKKLYLINKFLYEKALKEETED